MLGFPMYLKTSPRISTPPMCPYVIAMSPKGQVYIYGRLSALPDFFFLAELTGAHPAEAPALFSDFPHRGEDQSEIHRPGRIAS